MVLTTTQQGGSYNTNRLPLRHKKAVFIKPQKKGGSYNTERWSLQHKYAIALIVRPTWIPLLKILYKGLATLLSLFFI